jgi:hypothetical protein
VRGVQLRIAKRWVCGVTTILRGWRGRIGVGRVGRRTEKPAPHRRAVECGILQLDAQTQRARNLISAVMPTERCRPSRRFTSQSVFETHPASTEHLHPGAVI